LTDPSLRGGEPSSPKASPAPSTPGGPATDALPHKTCPKCGGKLTIDYYRPREKGGIIWDADCLGCGATVAQWLPGDPGWTPLFTKDGARIPNPLNVPGYGQPDEPDAADTPHGDQKAQANKGGPSTSPPARPELALGRGARFHHLKTRLRNRLLSEMAEEFAVRPQRPGDVGRS
jgi:hypothetical protein